MSRFKKACALILLALFVPLTLDAARAPDWKHEDIWLKNEHGQRITPTRNSTDPYSPRKTCGTCHGYMTVTSGTHFQQGFDEMKDGYDPKRPWVLSPGNFGKGGDPGTFTERVAAKKNASARDMGHSTYDWIAAGGKIGSKGQVIATAPGWTHPGGGPMEFGRKADGRRDLSKNLAQGEPLKPLPLDGDYSSRYTPDGKSRFRASGVVEGDCLMCHLKGYRLDARNRSAQPAQLPLGRHGRRGAGRDPGRRVHLQQPRCRAGRRGLRQGFVEFCDPPRRPLRMGGPQTLHARGKIQGKRADQQIRRSGQLHPVPPPDGRAEIGHPLPARRRSAPQGGAALHRLPHPGGKDAGRTPAAPDRQGVVADGHGPQRPRRRGDEDLRRLPPRGPVQADPGGHAEGSQRTPTTSTARSSTRRRSTSTCFTARPATPRSGRPAASISWITARDSRRGTRRTRRASSPGPTS